MARIIQISDAHLFADKSKQFLGVKTWDTLNSVLKAASQYRQNDSVTILTGDLAQDHNVDTYILLADIITSFSGTVYWIPGNHDSVNNGEIVFSSNNIAMPRDFVLQNWHIILLNSHWGGHVVGFIDEMQRQELKSLLAAHKAENALIFIHHHLLPVESFWLDKLMTRNSSDVMAIISNYDHVRAISWGHVHQEGTQYFNKIACYSTPATSFQFEPKCRMFKLGTQMPGFRYFDLFSNGDYKTEVVRVPYNEEYVPDLNIPGF